MPNFAATRLTISSGSGGALPSAVAVVDLPCLFSETQQLLYVLLVVQQTRVWIYILCTTNCSCPVCCQQLAPGTYPGGLCFRTGACMLNPLCHHATAGHVSWFPCWPMGLECPFVFSPSRPDLASLMVCVKPPMQVSWLRFAGLIALPSPPTSDFFWVHALHMLMYGRSVPTATQLAYAAC